ncbi:MAG: prepilin peptidase [Candidatus Omnitrophica bacterium]|nr:prepilin peptidase [Candidatus Omnitrophota bacterium]
MADILGLPQFFWITLIFALGACIGSFLNVCIFRWPQEELSIVRPRSFCPSCKEMIAWYDNIPVVSFILLRGRCRRCAWRISPHYPLVELLYALIFVWFFTTHGFTARFAFNSVFMALLLIATITDFQTRIIPDEVSFYGILFAMLMSFIFPGLQNETGHKLALADATLGVLLGGGLLYIIAVVGDAMFKRESMGGGDIKLLAMIGAFLGYRFVFPTMFFASLLGSAIGIFLKLTRKEETIAFGPYLAMGAVVLLLWGDWLLQRFFPFL